MNNKGLSLLEIVISLLIMAVVMSGLGAAFMSGKKFISYNRSKMVAVEDARIRGAGFLSDVREDLYDHAANDYRPAAAITNRLQIVGNRSDDVFGSVADQLEEQNRIAAFTTNTRPPGVPATSQMRKVSIRMEWEQE